MVFIYHCQNIQVTVKWVKTNTLQTYTIHTIINMYTFGIYMQLYRFVFLHASMPSITIEINSTYLNESKKNVQEFQMKWIANDNLKNIPCLLLLFEEVRTKMFLSFFFFIPSDKSIFKHRLIGLLNCKLCDIITVYITKIPPSIM